MKRPRVNLRTPRVIVSQVRLFFARLVYYTLFGLLFAGVFYFLFFSEWLEIHNLSVEGNNIVDQKTILGTAEPYLHKKRFWIFPSNNFFLVPVRQIEKELLGNYKRISSVEIKKFLPHSLVISVKEKKAVLLFCSDKGCTWVDEEGVAYNKSTYTEALNLNVGVVIIQDNSGKAIPLGSAATSAKLVAFANGIAKNFTEITRKEVGFLSVPLPSAEEIRVHTKEGWIAYFDINFDLEKSLALLDQTISQNLAEEQKSTDCLEYVDLRIVDRIFYKLKPEYSEDSKKAEEENPPGDQDSQNQNANKAGEKKDSKKKKN
ncbi:MAG: FtsQ-type POTRA domain-containing protein [Candidatus Moranbacteria bacterium]|nr:FtsQ-type POTRA domain-containing protein [Candidatus Moranbacteria bacterium]